MKKKIRARSTLKVSVSSEKQTRQLNFCSGIISLMDDTRGHSLDQFCTDVRHARKKIVKDGKRKLTKERIARLDALGFEW